MFVKQNNIRKVENVLSDLEKGTKFYMGVNINSDIELIIKEKLIEDQDEDDVKIGTKIFPKSNIGIMNRRNAIGEYIVNKDKPLEAYEFALNWVLPDWSGGTRTGTSYITKFRYHRDFIEPKEFKLLIIGKENNDLVIIVDKEFENIETHYENIKFSTNLLLEIFGQAQTFKIDDDNNIIVPSDLKNVNWGILPAGERIWDAFSRGIIANISDSEKKMMEERFNFLEKFKPSKRYKGLGGYNDYIIFEYEELNTYIVESSVYGNATYILQDEWKKVSQLTKKEIINGNLAEDRIVHNNNWKSNIERYLPRLRDDNH